MKANRIISLFAAAALTVSVSAQQSVHDNYVGVNFGGGLNTMVYKAANGQHGVGGGIETGLFYGRFFNRMVGLGVGLQYTWANSYADYNWQEVTPGLAHPSNPNTPYILTTGFNKWRERQNMGVLSIPVEVLFRKALNDRAAFIGGLGLSLDFPIHGSYSAKGGDYSTTGMFPELGSYTISNMPEHGFYTYTDIPDKKMANRAKVGASVLCDLGFRVALNDNWGMYMGIYAGYGFTNLLKEAKTEAMVVINDQQQISYHGTFDSNETAKANLLRCGVKIAIDFGWPTVEKKAEAERLAQEEADRLAAEKAAREKAEAERLAHEEAERLAAEKAAAEAAAKAEAERLAAEKAAAEAAAKAEAERHARIEALKAQGENVNVHFETAGADLRFKDDEQNIIDEICDLMKADPSLRIVITGHTDNTGDPEQNLRYFGMNRAEALKAYMVSQGVAAEQIECESRGQNEPVADNATREGRSLNRRANIKFL